MSKQIATPAYRVYTKINFADTMRDPDDIKITEKGYYFNIENAREVARDYVRTHYSDREKTRCLQALDEGQMMVCEICSYPTAVIIETINIQP